ncbi:MAG: hypothetical protein U5L76_03660 [Patescibacteria group bacterium]|nr:hypothetical protein [Patescibacteria group bacterium]
MRENFEEPKSSQENLAHKKEELLKTVDLMLDFKKSDALKEIIEKFKDLTGDEIDYLAEYVRLTDFQVGQRGHFLEVAKEGAEEIRSNLEKMKEKVRPEILIRLDTLSKLV